LGIAAYRWFNMEMERESHPNLQRWYDLLTQRPPFQEHIMQPME
jgi:glutathione S-transferase